MGWTVSASCRETGDNVFRKAGELWEWTSERVGILLCSVVCTDYDRSVLGHVLWLIASVMTRSAKRDRQPACFYIKEG